LPFFLKNGSGKPWQASGGIGKPWQALVSLGKSLRMHSFNIYWSKSYFFVKEIHIELQT
jgi:hypothetical protein